jgi:hypothetical protein
LGVDKKKNVGGGGGGKTTTADDDDDDDDHVGNHHDGEQPIYTSVSVDRSAPTPTTKAITAVPSSSSSSVSSSSSSLSTDEGATKLTATKAAPVDAPKEKKSFWQVSCLFSCFLIFAFR